MNVLVTGGAGYLGSALLPMLLNRGDSVTVLDTLLWGIEPLLHVAANPRLHIISEDIRDRAAVRDAMNGQDAVIHLGSVVGYPACEADREAAVSTNIDGTRNVMEAAEGRPFLFASTCSVYGRVLERCDEATPVRPLSLYGVTKAKAEEIATVAGGAVLRFATLYGIAPRLRLDLLVNDFTHQAVHSGRLTIYEPHFRRTFLHVMDAARSLIFCLDNYRHMAGHVFNVADERTTTTKLELAQKIQEQVDFQIYTSGNGSDRDQRDYEVSAARICQLGFAPQLTLEEGIRELVKVTRHVRTREPVSRLTFAAAPGRLR